MPSPRDGRSLLLPGVHSEPDVRSRLLPALLMFAILNGWTQSILDDINEVSVQVVNLVVGHRNAMKGSQAA